MTLELGHGEYSLGIYAVIETKHLRGVYVQVLSVIGPIKSAFSSCATPTELQPSRAVAGNLVGSYRMGSSIRHSHDLEAFSSMA